jgi:hypothetical protein
MAAITPLSSRSSGERLALVVVVPLVFGVVVGLTADVSGLVYWILNALAIVGALLAGAEMASPREGAVRGVIAGLLYGIGILVGHAIVSGGVASGVPELNAGTPIVTAIISALLGALGALGRPRTREA